MTVPIPIPLPPWARFIVRYGPAVGGFLWALVDYLREESDPVVLEWRRVLMRTEDLASADAKDDMWTSLDLVNITGGTVDSTWTTADYTTCEGHLTTMWGVLKNNMNTGYKVSEYRWYRRRFNPYTNSDPFAISGPPERVTSVSITGMLSTRHISQAAMSITEKTCWPKHWGRFYIGGLGHVISGSGGRFTNSDVDNAATPVSSAYSSLASAEFFPVVPVTQVNKDPFRALLGVTQIQVDNVPDVIRRRRLASTTYRKVLP